MTNLFFYFLDVKLFIWSHNDQSWTNFPSRAKSIISRGWNWRESDVGKISNTTTVAKQGTRRCWTINFVYKLKNWDPTKICHCHKHVSSKTSQVSKKDLKNEHFQFPYLFCRVVLWQGQNISCLFNSDLARFCFGFVFISAKAGPLSVFRINIGCLHRKSTITCHSNVVVFINLEIN